MQQVRGHQNVQGGRGRRASFVLRDDDWTILALLTEPTHLNALPMKVAQRCLHLYKAGYPYKDQQGWVVLSLHGRRELARWQRTH